MLTFRADILMQLYTTLVNISAINEQVLGVETGEHTFRQLLPFKQISFIKKS